MHGIGFLKGFDSFLWLFVSTIHNTKICPHIGISGLQFKGFCIGLDGIFDLIGIVIQVSKSGPCFNALRVGSYFRLQITDGLFCLVVQLCLSGSRVGCISLIIMHGIRPEFVRCKDYTANKTKHQADEQGVKQGFFFNQVLCVCHCFSFSIFERINK